MPGRSNGATFTVSTGPPTDDVSVEHAANVVASKTGMEKRNWRASRRVLVTDAGMLTGSWMLAHFGQVGKHGSLLKGFGIFSCLIHL